MLCIRCLLPGHIRDVQADWTKLLQAKLLSPEDVNLRHNSTGASVEWETMDVKAQDQHLRQKAPVAQRPRRQSGPSEPQLPLAESQQQLREEAQVMATGSSAPQAPVQFLTSSTTLLDQLLPWPSHLERSNVLSPRRVQGAGIDRTGSPSPDLLKDFAPNETTNFSITLRPTRSSASLTPKRGRSGESDLWVLLTKWWAIPAMCAQYAWQ